MNIDSIKNGIVIDHIQAKKGMEIYELLELEKLDCSVAIITNAKSEKMGRKDIIKINKDIKLDLDILGYIDPNITINIIKKPHHFAIPHQQLKNHWRQLIAFGSQVAVRKIDPYQLRLLCFIQRQYQIVAG